jgi:hypothetical protein
MPRVLCRAVYCAHNLGGEICNAAIIEVNRHKQPGQERTDCSTFIPRDLSGSLLSLENVNYSGLVAQAFSGQPVASPEVICTVTDCRYNQNSVVCSAEEVMVLDRGALSSLETFCETYWRIMES